MENNYKQIGFFELVGALLKAVKRFYKILLVLLIVGAIVFAALFQLTAPTYQYTSIIRSNYLNGAELSAVVRSNLNNEGIKFVSSRPINRKGTVEVNVFTPKLTETAQLDEKLIETLNNNVHLKRVSMRLAERYLSAIEQVNIDIDKLDSNSYKAELITLKNKIQFEIDTNKAFVIVDLFNCKNSNKPVSPVQKAYSFYYILSVFSIFFLIVMGIELRERKII